MGRVRSDVRAVVAILVGAAGGVAGTVAVVEALDRGSSEPAACVGLEAPVVVHSRGDGAAIVLRAPSPAPKGAACSGLGVGRSITVIRARGDAPSVRVLTDEIRIHREAPGEASERYEAIVERYRGRVAGRKPEEASGR